MTYLSCAHWSILVRSAGLDAVFMKYCVSTPAAMRWHDGYSHTTLPPAMRDCTPQGSKLGKLYTPFSGTVFLALAECIGLTHFANELFNEGHGIVT